MRSIVLSLAGVFFLAMALAPSAAQEGKGKPRPQKWIGQLSKLDGDKLTITKRGDSGASSETVTIDKETKIRMETDQDEKVKVKSEGGEREITRPKMIDAKLADLKVGQRVAITFTAEKRAVEVLGLRAVKERKEGEGR